MPAGCRPNNDGWFLHKITCLLMAFLQVQVAHHENNEVNGSLHLSRVGKELGVADRFERSSYVFTYILRTSCSGGFPSLTLDWAPSEKSPQPLLLLPAACEMAAHLYHHL